MRVHVSDVKAFLTCERKYAYSSPNFLGLEKKRIVNHFFLGKLVHSVLEAYYQKYFHDMEDGYDKILDIYIDNHGGIENLLQLYPKFYEDTDNLREVMIDYQDFYMTPFGSGGKLSDSNLQFITFETPIEFDLTETIQFGGRIDGLVRTLSDGKLWILEHKTSANPSRLIDTLDNEMQTDAYIIAARLQGWDVSGVLYNIISKKVSKYPSLLKNGTISQAKTPSVSYNKYYKMVMALPKEDRQAYVPILTYFANTDNYFVRQTVERSEAQLNNFKRMLIEVAERMESTTTYLPTGASNPINCDRCAFKWACIAQNNDEDIKVLLAKNYKKRTDRNEGMFFVPGYIGYKKQDKYTLYGDDTTHYFDDMEQCINFLLANNINVPKDLE